MTPSGIKLRPLLRAVAFGESVAEYDQHLSSYFIETSSFLDIAADRVDLILGDKGTGKSAIFYHLANPNAEISQLELVDIVPAFNVQGSVIFRKLSGRSRLPEDAYRYMWLTFIIGMIANHLIYKYGETVDLTTLTTLLERANLRVEEPSAKRLWEKIEALLDEITSRLEAEGELEFGIPKIPVKARARGRLTQRHRSSRQEPDEVDLEQVLYLCDNAYREMNRQCWVLFDRLDEAFEQDRDLESIALRSLLRAHIDLASFKLSLRTKLFLRNDVFSRVVRGKGFVNATHLRKHNINWDADAALDLIVRRIISNPKVVEFFHINRDGLGDHRAREAACSHILPSFIEAESLMEWIEVNTVDAKGSLNPRNIISLLSFARQRQLEVYDRDDPFYDEDAPLITVDALNSGFNDLSNNRLEDTVLAEFPILGEFVERVRDSAGRARLQRRELSELLNCSFGSPKYNSMVDALRDAGVLKLGSAHSATVARLYRPALQIKSHKAEMRKDELADLREIVDLAVKEIIDNGITGVKLAPMEVAERKYIHEYVKSKYPDHFTTSSVPTRRRDTNDSTKQIVINVIT